MRRLVLLFAMMMMLVASLALAQEHSPAAAQGHEHPAKTYFGIPGWVLKTLNMVVFFGLLGFAIKKPVVNALAARSEQIRREMAEARERRQKSDQMAAEIQARLTAIEEDVRGIRERAEAEGQRQRQELIAAAEAEAAKILQAARNEVDNRLKSARRELTEYAGQLATERAESILRETITESDQRKLFEESLRQVGEVKT
ncbi:MAG: F0F1 ATP synthase subunit B family protein [Thermoanaerobaculia bacterium]